MIHDRAHIEIFYLVLFCYILLFMTHEEHNIPDKGFVVNIRIQDELDIELNKIKPSQMYEEC